MKTYKGHKYDNTVIEVLNPEHGKNVVKPFWESQGIIFDNTSVLNYSFFCAKSNNSNFRYYGLKDGIFKNYSESDLQGVKIITLPIETETPAFPYLAKCWDNDETDCVIIYVVGKIENSNPTMPYVCTDDFDAIRRNLIYDSDSIMHYTNAEPINETFESVSAENEKLKRRRDELQDELTNLEQQITYCSVLERILINE